MLQRVIDSPFIPRRFSLAQKGMNTDRFVDYAEDYERWFSLVQDWWLPQRDLAVAGASQGLALGLHKQDVNRLLEPFMMHTAIISATNWDNFFDQRLAVNEKGSPLAYIPIYDVAKAMKCAIKRSVLSDNAQFLELDQWHTPLANFPGDEDLTVHERRRVSVARCARVSYLTQEGIRDPAADLELYDRLLDGKHLSPFEHVAHPSILGSGNFRGWTQARHYVEIRNNK
jgi:hypothetical protein